MSKGKKTAYDGSIAKQVQTMAQYGVAHDDIASAVGLSKMTLRKLYMAELDKGKALAHAAVAKKLFERCMAGSEVCLIFYAKTQLKWKETQEIDLSSGFDIKVNIIRPDSHEAD